VNSWSQCLYSRFQIRTQSGCREWVSSIRRRQEIT
jgi:hypothetical protein